MTELLFEKPDALCQLSTEEHGIIAASAGTGKTYTLQHLVIEILLDHEQVRLDEILLVTFTVAATSDLKSKIRQTLEYLVEGWELARARGFDRARLTDDGISDIGDETPGDSDWTIDRQGVDRLRHALRNFDRAAIYTIHGFCQRILVEHAFANRRLFEQEHVSDEDVIAEAFAELLRRDIRPGTEQERWLTAYLGAGNSISGLRDKLADFVQAQGEYRPVETVDLEAFDRFIQRLVPLLEELDPEQWKEEIKPRVQDADGPTARQSNAIGGRLEELVENFVPQYRPDDPVANLFALNNAFKNSKRMDYFGKDKSRIVLELAGQLGEALMGIEDYNKNCELIVINRLGETLRSRVEELKAREGYFTFSDMVRVVRDTLYEEDDGTLLESIRAEFRYGLIDEFQDTDRDQWDIFRKVFIDSPADDRHFLYLIGDPKQAIYGFRGGDVYTYLEACQILKDRGVDQVPLRHNYRSTPAVLDACNAIFDSTIDEPVELGEGIEYEPRGVEAGRSWLCLREDGERVDAGVTAFDLTTSREKPGVGQVRGGLIDCYAREIADIVNGGRDLEYLVEDGEGNRTWKPVGAEDIFVLCRRRKELRWMADALRNQGVPFAFLKLPGLFQTPEAEDIYDLLLALDAPQDRSRRARAWMTPFFDLDLTDLEGMSRIDESDEIYARLLRWSRFARSGEFTVLFNQLVERSGLIRRRLLLERGERELTNYLHIFELLADEASRGIQTVADLARRLKAFIDGRATPEGEDAEQQRLETEQRAVQLLTIHGSKGLERGLVFVVPKLSRVGTNPPLRFHEPDDEGRSKLVEWHDKYGRLPGDLKKKYRRAATAEELRLSYVAITRAALMAYVPYAAEETVIRDKIDKDPFGQVVDRLEQLRADGEDDAIEFRPASIDVRTPKPSSEQIRQSLIDLESFDVDVESLDADAQRQREQQRRLLARRWEVTSFSKLKQRGRTAHTEDEKAGDDAEPAGRQVLPGGMGTGNFLHLVLEELDYGLVDQFERDDWIVDDEIRRFFETRARRFGRFDDAAIDAAMGMVYDTLRAPVQLDGETQLDGLHRLDSQRISRELEFLFPAPEQRDQRWHRAFRSGTDVEGGFVTGVVDLLFEHDCKVYFADWKSDLAHPYDDRALSRLIEQRYARQANIYSLAVCRMLGIETEEDYARDFGGYFYFLIRGMTPDEPGRGIYSGKVDFADLVGWEQQLEQVVRDAKVSR